MLCYVYVGRKDDYVYVVYVWVNVFEKKNRRLFNDLRKEKFGAVFIAKSLMYEHLFIRKNRYTL